MAEKNKKDGGTRGAKELDILCTFNRDEKRVLTLPNGKTSYPGGKMGKHHQGRKTPYLRKIKKDRRETGLTIPLLQKEGRSKTHGHNIQGPGNSSRSNRESNQSRRKNQKGLRRSKLPLGLGANTIFILKVEARRTG